jgi:hypothetical protein
MERPEEEGRMTTLEAVQIGVPRWLALALPDDAAQEVALVDLMHPHLTPRARREMIAYRMRCLRVEVWERRPSRTPRVPHGLRPSKLAARTGYRTDSAAHREARLTLDPAVRRAIARKGASSCKTEGTSSNPS